MIGDGEEDFGEALAEHRLGRTGVQITLDKGFEEGVYCIYVNYGSLASRVGFLAAQREAQHYGALLKNHLSRITDYGLGEMEDASRSGDPRRRRDLESTFLDFPVVTDDGSWHDDAMKQQFRVALLRADQEWDQAQARSDSHRRQVRVEAFRRRLGTLLEGESYRHVDAATKERLLADVTALVFQPKGREL